MAVRIYTLAKDLKVDSKELVDICARIGISGKGSALASLSDEEAVKIQEYFKGAGGAKPGPSRSGAPVAAPERPREPVKTSKMPVLPPARPSSPLGGFRKPPRGDEEPAPEEQPTPLDIAAESTAAETIAATVAPPRAPAEPEGPRSPGPLAGRMRREEYVGPGQVGGRPPTLEEISGPRTVKPGGPARPQQPARPAVKLAPMPAQESPRSIRSRPGDPVAIKPDMKLPADAMKASKSGGKPLAAHLRRHEDAIEEAKKAKEKEKGLSDAEIAKGRRGKLVKGKGDAEPEPGAPLLGGREERQMARRRTAQIRGDDEPSMGSRRISRAKKRPTGANTAAPRKERVSIQLPCTIRELSEAAGVPAAAILRILMNEGLSVMNINAQIDPDMTELIASELGISIDFTTAMSLEEEFLDEIRNMVDHEEDLVARPPVITFLGHVDHGKTSLLDKLIGINVVKGESGGITQHIRAYQIEKDGKRISFVDTPGHEAFTEMRARGANVTDIAVLVVAADDGVMPQTEEAISHARAAGVPIVVALNKIDLPGVDPTRTYQQLAANELLPSEWGGDVEVVKTSATIGTGLEELLDTLLTVAELHDYKANPRREALGTCLEARQQADRGVMATVMVQNGTLKTGDVVVCGDAFGRVKVMEDTLDRTKRFDAAGPSTPVNLWGFDVAPAAGEHFFVLDDIALAREIAEARALRDRSDVLGSREIQHVTLENLFERLDDESETQTLNLILRADVRGSIEAILKEFGKLEHPEVKLKVLQATVGGISEADVTLADASDAIIIGFNVAPDEGARSQADKRGVQVRRYDVIYKITDDLKAALEGMLRPEKRDVELGRALVQQVYKISRVGSVAGCRVLSGTIERNSRARIIRDSVVIGDYGIDTLKREKDDAKEVREGLECGIKLAGFNDVKEGDILEVYKVEEVGRKFDS